MAFTAEQIDVTCPACGHRGLAGFHDQPSVPVNSCLLVTDRAEAVDFPQGAIRLGLCPDCGFMTNTAFDPALAEYSQRYEETQGFSPRFLQFARTLATEWIERYDLSGKRVLEIGCGKGEFLALMAEGGIGHGIGIDPGVDPDRVTSPAAERLTWLQRRFTADDGDLIGDAVVCRHTLEHIGPVGAFLADLRRAIGDRVDTVVLFELPDSQRVLDEVAFWDVYYEHAAYFTEGSLSRLFERHGFEILDLRKEYDDQYLILEAKPNAGAGGRPRAADDLAAIFHGAETFRSGYAAAADYWRQRLAAESASGGRTVIWGASSKGVAFLGIAGDQVAAAVDVNPHKHGTYVAGTGHRVLSPRELQEVRPSLVVAMNPIYLDEIGTELEALGIEATLIGV